MTSYLISFCLSFPSAKWHIIVPTTKFCCDDYGKWFIYYRNWQYKLRFLFIRVPILYHTTELLPLSLFKIVKLPPSSLGFVCVPHPHCIILNTTNHHLKDHICYFYLLSIPPWLEYKLHKGRNFWQFVFCCISSI